MVSFSVVIPTYNRRAYLAECLASVFGQSAPPHEIIVVDDGSTDGTREYLESLGTRVRSVVSKNGGPGAARNIGAALAQGDYLAFLDSDDIWFPWTLATFASLIQKHGNPSLLFARYLDFYQRSELDAVSFHEPAGQAFDVFLSAHRSGYSAGAGMMVIARSVFERSGGFLDDRLNAEDHDLALRLGLAPGFVQVTEPVCIGHRVHAGNEMGDLTKTVRGLTRLINREQAGVYPGGAEWATQRRRIIARHVRPAILACTRRSDLTSARHLYRETFAWNIQDRRYAFLLGTPVLMARAVLPLSL